MPHAQAPLVSHEETRQVLVRVARRDIGLLCSYLAGYEGVAIVRTLDPQQGLVELLVAPAFYEVATTLLCALAQDIDLESLAVPYEKSARER